MVSYFSNIVNVTESELFNIIEFEIIPLLKEYWFDEPSKVDIWKVRLRMRFNGFAFDMKPAFETIQFKQYQEFKNPQFEALIDAIQALNVDIRDDDDMLGEGFVIGHSYFNIVMSQNLNYLILLNSKLFHY